MYIEHYKMRKGGSYKMTAESTIDLSLLLSLFTIIFVGLTYYRTSKKDTSNDVKE